MICLRCGKNGKEQYCNSCFLLIFEKRVKKALRESKLLKQNICLAAEDQYSLYLAKKLITMPILFRKRGKRMIREAGGNKKVILVRLVSETIDDTNALFLADLIGIHKKRFMGLKKTINLFQHVNDAEVQRYFSLKNMKYNMKYKAKQHPLKEHLSKLIEKYPEINYALHQAASEYHNIKK